MLYSRLASVAKWDHGWLDIVIAKENFETTLHIMWWDSSKLGQLKNESLYCGIIIKNHEIELMWIY